ncbi:MAG: DNA recombination protein RmuC [Vicinamibacterales bacterium]|nr:DNA recombination protein RmuC [Vicinamibacterales bacterium]
MDTTIVYAAAAGAAGGAFLAWLVARALMRRDMADTAAVHQGAVSSAQTLFQETAKRLGEVQDDLVRTRDELEQARGEASYLREQHAKLSTELDHQRAAVPAQMALLEKAQLQLKDSFSALAGATLRQNNEEFLKLAQERLGQRQQAFDELVRPIREALASVDKKLGEVEHNRVQTGTELQTLLKAVGQSQHQLRMETQQLVRALRAPQVRGRWGEIQLRRVVEMAGMLHHCDFQEQPSAATETGRLRPDLIVTLPGDRTVVIDAKVPLEAYLDLQEAQDDVTRQQCLQAHARQVREHMQKLSAKGYWEQFQPSPEFVIMFLPGEAIFQAALQQDVGLIDFGVGQRVFPASPITLIALLRAVAHGWREERLAKNAEEVSTLGKELYERVTRMTGHLDTLRTRLDGTVRAFNDTVGSYETRVLVTARRFKELGATSAEDITPLQALDAVPRVLQTANLLGLPDEADEDDEAGETPGD